MAKVKIVNMMFYGFHGTYEYEREQGQKFYLDAEMTTGDVETGNPDNAVEIVNPATVYSIIKDVLENKRFMLLEELSAHIGDRVLSACPQIISVLIRIRKPAVPIPGPIDYIEVEAERHRK